MSNSKVIDEVCALADKMVSSGAVREAVVFTTEAIVVAQPSTDLFKLWWQRAACNFIDGKYADAAKDLDAAAAVMPADQVAFFQTYGAMLMCAGGRRSEAVSVFDKALALEATTAPQLATPKFMHRIPVDVVRALRAKALL